MSRKNQRNERRGRRGEDNPRRSSRRVPPPQSRAQELREAAAEIDEQLLSHNQRGMRIGLAEYEEDWCAVYGETPVDPYAWDHEVDEDVHPGEEEDWGLIGAEDLYWDEALDIDDLFDFPPPSPLTLWSSCETAVAG